MPDESKKKKSIAEKILGIFSLRTYYYIPPCPKCGSRVTGRYRAKTIDYDDVELDSLKHGEIVRPASAEPIKNAFCCDCGYTWGCTASLKLWSVDRIQEEKEARGTDEAYRELLEIMRIQKKGALKKGYHFFTGR